MCDRVKSWCARKDVLAFGFILLGACILPVFTSVLATPPCTRSVLRFPEREYHVQIADTPDLRARGLSGVPRLASSTGMLFVFDESALHSFWMKGMNFPLDIVWLDEQWRVVDVASQVLPETFPKGFVPTAPARYVLELAAGEAKAGMIATGTRALFHSCPKTE
jgi:uncharacterized protein